MDFQSLRRRASRVRRRRLAKRRGSGPAAPWMRALEPYTRLGALVGGIPNTGTLLHQGALPIGMRTELAKTLHLEAPAPPRQAPAKPDTETPANEEAETAADAAEGEPES